MRIRTAQCLLMGALVCTGLSAAAQTAQHAPVAELALVRESAPEQPAAISLQLARVVVGMLGYTYWPEPSRTRTFCVMPLSQFESVLLEKVPQLQGRETWHAVAQADASVQTVLASCDALYYSLDFAKSHTPLLGAVRRQPMLTILENSPVCDEGSLFCIDTSNVNRITFQANLEAMSLSTLRVNPQVLRMGREGP
ncbi:YfiR family protein [Lampropedia aestuarii]|uniref:YfiR family protein n=1 Tax=Lampropedia aestuarii TaxID=2562762 RepID=A0A4S5BKL2_9BURK|nr:YfiR family protein [Lampropedia aestuarii]MDH5859020.1 YfiR family protein [Lampropedia aestuarii]THJ32769.1 YfiR family protein [Lampropedia aestuarii]